MKRPVMALDIKKRSRKAGLPPGALVHIGRQREEKPKTVLIEYTDQSVSEREIDGREIPGDAGMPSPVRWMNVEGLHEVGLLEKIGSRFALHPLVLEDILNTDQRAKVEDYGDYLYCVVKAIRVEDERTRISSEQISLIVGRTFVISFQEGLEGDVFDAVRDRIRGDKGRIRKMGPDYLAYSLLDAVVDHYFGVLEYLGERIGAAEERLVSEPGEQTLREIYALKREMLFFRKAVWPLRDVIASLERRDSVLVAETTRPYLRDVYDHIIQVIDTTETFREMVSGMFEIYLSSVSNRLNGVMKVLTVIATVFMPLTFIVGIYGMNFRHMPELEWRFGYLMVWIVMIGIGLSMIAYFKIKKWI